MIFEATGRDRTSRIGWPGGMGWWMTATDAAVTYFYSVGEVRPLFLPLVDHGSLSLQLLIAHILQGACMGWDTPSFPSNWRHVGREDASDQKKNPVPKAI